MPRNASLEPKPDASASASRNQNVCDNFKFSELEELFLEQWKGFFTPDRFRLRTCSKTLVNGAFANAEMLRKLES